MSTVRSLLLLMLAGVVVAACTRSAQRTAPPVPATDQALSPYAARVVASLEGHDLDAVTRDWPTTDALPGVMETCDWVEISRDREPAEDPVRFTVLVDGTAQQFWLWRTIDGREGSRISGPAVLDSGGIIEVGAAR